MATELRSKFPKAGLTELASAEAEAWAKESFEIATETAYQNGTRRGPLKGQHKEYDSAEEPHFLFVIDAKNACDSNAKFAINKFSSTFIPTREK